MWSVSLLMRNAARTLSARYWSAFVASLLYWLFFIVCVVTLYLLNGRLFLLDVFLMALCFFTYNGCLFVGLKRFFQEFRRNQDVKRPGLSPGRTVHFAVCPLMSRCPNR